MNFFLHISLYIGHFVSDIFIKVEFVRLKGIHKLLLLLLNMYYMSILRKKFLKINVFYYIHTDSLYACMLKQKRL